MFGLEKMDILELFMFRTVFRLKKMNTFYLFMLSINISPRVQSASGRQALYDLGQSFIYWSGWTAKQFFEIIAFDIQRTFADDLLDSEQGREDKIRYAGTVFKRISTTLAPNFPVAPVTNNFMLVPSNFFTYLM